MLVQKSEDILTPEGVMEVWLIEAENVPKMDFFGSGQPFGKCAICAAIAPCSLFLQPCHTVYFYQCAPFNGTSA